MEFFRATRRRIRVTPHKKLGAAAVNLAVRLLLLVAVTAVLSPRVICGADVTESKVTIQGRAVEIPSIRARFQLPTDWIERHSEFQDNIHISTAELQKIRTAEGEWDREYSRILNKALPFESCILHAGDEAWGRSASSFHDLQMRIYIIKEKPSKVIDRFVEDGWREASRLSKKVSNSCNKRDQWQTILLRYHLWYRDYGGTANIEVFAQPVAGKNETVAMVFMYCDSQRDQNAVAAKIVESFAINR